MRSDEVLTDLLLKTGLNEWKSFHDILKELLEVTICAKLKLAKKLSVGPL